MKVEESYVGEHRSGLRDLRQAYELEVSALADEANALKSSGGALEDIARHVVARRRDIAIRYKELTPEPARSRAYARSEALYGDPAGPTVEALRAGGKAWEEIIESAARPGRGLSDSA